MPKQVIYTALDYEAYKELEIAMKNFQESTHASAEGFYHKSIRLPIGDGVVMEFHGPLVMAGILPLNNPDGSDEDSLPFTDAEADAYDALREALKNVVAEVGGIQTEQVSVNISVSQDHPARCECEDCVAF